MTHSTLKVMRRILNFLPVPVTALAWLDFALTFSVIRVPKAHKLGLTMVEAGQDERMNSSLNSTYWQKEMDSGNVSVRELKRWILMTQALSIMFPVSSA